MQCYTFGVGAARVAVKASPQDRGVEKSRVLSPCGRISVPEESLADAIGESAARLQKTTPFWKYQYHGTITKDNRSHGAEQARAYET